MLTGWPSSPTGRSGPMRLSSFPGASIFSGIMYSGNHVLRYPCTQESMYLGVHVLRYICTQVSMHSGNHVLSYPGTQVSKCSDNHVLRYRNHVLR